MYMLVLTNIDRGISVNMPITQQTLDRLDALSRKESREELGEWMAILLETIRKRMEENNG